MTRDCLYASIEIDFIKDLFSYHKSTQNPRIVLPPPIEKRHGAFVLGIGATLIGSLLYGAFSTRELIKISGKIYGIRGDMTHIVEHLQGIEEKLKITELAIQRLNNSITAIATELTISNYETRLIETAHHVSDAMNQYAREVDGFVDGITDALARRLNEKIIPHSKLKRH